MPDRTLVLAIGFRAGVLGAAERLDVDVAVLDHREPPPELAPRLAGFRRVDWSGPPAELLAAARGLAAGRPVSAVIALTEGAVLPAALVREAFGAPGSDVATATRCSDKRAMKRAVRAAGIECAPFAEVAPADDPDELIGRLGLPLVLKRPASSGSRGLVVARDRETVRAELAGHELAEGFVEGTEMSVEGFLRDGRVLFSSTTRYVVPLHANVVRARFATQ